MTGWRRIGLAALDLVDDWLPAALIGFTIVTAGVDVALRNTVGTTIPDGIEMSTFAFVWSVFLGAAGASRRDRHFKVDLVGEHLPAVAARALAAAVDLVCAVVALAMTHTAWQYTMRSWSRTSEGLQLPLGYFYMVFPLSFALMVGTHLVRAAMIFRRGEKT